MTDSIDIPESVAHRMAAAGKELSRTALEGVALEGYRSRALSEGDLCEMLGLETRLQVHDFLADHGVELNYSMDDWLHDKAMVDEIAALRAAMRQ